MDTIFSFRGVSTKTGQLQISIPESCVIAAERRV